MTSYINFSNFSDQEILSMQREKKKEYIILIQSEKIATVMLNYYNTSLYTTNYHYRVNSEYYLLHERVTKKRLDDELYEIPKSIKIPLSSIITRLDESKNELLKINQSLYPEYSQIVDEIINKIKDLNVTIIYQNGTLYFVNGDEEILLDEEKIINLLINKEMVIQKTKH